MTQMYSVNGLKLTWRQLINLACDEGYISRDNFYTTSESAEFLRKKYGYEIKEVEDV